MSEEKKAHIRELNDALTHAGTGGEVVSTVGFGQLPAVVRHQAMWKVRTFTAFTENNDPHREHDFGSVWSSGYQIFWKIDYYDKAVEYGSEDPSDAEQTHRVMTIMLAEEY